MQLQFHVQEKENGLFLRDFLRLKKVSAGLCTAVKRDRGFFCNGSPIHTNARVHRGDCICFWLPPEQETTVKAQELPLSILYENAHAMVLEKPVGQAVHPTLGYPDGTLANAFCGEMQRRGVRTVFRPINRIDRGTSGMVLCAMNAYAAPLLTSSCQKIYYAIVEGVLPEPRGIIEAPIARCEDSLIKRQVSDCGKPSRTEYEVLCSHAGNSLVRCVPLTGRTHQIRVHFSWLGHPLIGDAFYGGRPELERPALHCGEMRFTVFHTVHVQLSLPEDMRSMLCKNDVDTKNSWLFDRGVFVKEV